MSDVYPDIPECFYRISVKAIIRDEDGKILFSQEDTGYWDLPGGGIDHGEDVFSALTREIKEEMGLTIKHIQTRPLCFCTARSSPIDNRTPKPRGLIMYEVEVENLDFVPSNECVKIDFFDLDEALKQNLYIGALDAVEALKKI